MGSRPDRVIPKTIIKMAQTASLPDTHALGMEFDSAARLPKRPSSVCRTVYGDMHLKDLLGSSARVGYCIAVPDSYLVLHDLRCRKTTIID